MPYRPGTTVRWIALLLAVGAWPVDATAAEPRCSQKGDETNRVTVTAAEILRCIVQGKTVDLDRVEIRGPIDLEQIPVTKIPAKSPTLLPGMPDPRTALALDLLERDLGRFVPGARLVRDRFSIQNSNVEAILGPRPDPRAATPHAPVVFLQLVNLRGTTVQNDITAPHTRFGLNVIATNMVVRGIVDLTSSMFRGNALFDDVVFYDRASFAQVEFSKVANFQRLDAARRITFAQAVFKDDAWFQGSPAKPTRLHDIDFTQVRAQAPLTLDDAVVEGAVTLARAQLERGLSLERTTLQGPLLVEDAAVAGGAQFIGARLLDRASFARTTFTGSDAVSFLRAEFGKFAQFIDVTFKGPAIFVKTVFNHVRFGNVDFGDTADFRHAQFGVAGEFGAAAERTTFNKTAEFDFARLARGSFQNALFKGRAKFVGTQFGNAACAHAGAVAVNFDGALFADTANFESASFVGRLNFPRVVSEPGRLLFRWRDLAGVVATEPLMLTDSAWCHGQRDFVADRTLAVPKREALLRTLETNFRSRDLLDDANAAYYEARHAEVRAMVGDAREGYGSRAGALTEMALYGYTSGYGVFPSRVAVVLGMCLVVFTALYVASGRTFVYGPASAGMPIRWKVTELPARPTKNLVGDHGPLPHRLLAATCVSLAALASVTVRDTKIELTADDRWWWVVFAERMIGLALILLLGVTLANSVPVLSKFLGWLL